MTPIDDETLKALIAASEGAPAWGVWVDYALAPPGSYACLMSSFENGKWTAPKDCWMPAQMRPHLRGQHKIMPYLMPSDPLTEQLACNNAAALAREVLEARLALRMFMGAATPVATEIDPRGYRWSEAYLDQARATQLKGNPDE